MVDHATQKRNSSLKSHPELADVQLSLCQLKPLLCSATKLSPSDSILNKQYFPLQYYSGHWCCPSALH